MALTEQVIKELHLAGDRSWSALLGTMKAGTRLEQAQTELARALGADQRHDHNLLQARHALQDAPIDEAVAQIRLARRAIDDYLTDLAPAERFPALNDLDDLVKREFSAYIFLPKELDRPDTLPTVLLFCDAAGKYQQSNYISVRSTSDAIVTAPEVPVLQGDKFTIAVLVATCVVSVLVNRFRREHS